MDSAQVGARLRKIRQDAGISQEVLSGRCSVSRSVIGEIERGERVVTVTDLVRLAGGLGVSPATVLEGGDRVAQEEEDISYWKVRDDIRVALSHPGMMVGPASGPEALSHYLTRAVMEAPALRALMASYTPGSRPDLVPRVDYMEAFLRAQSLSVELREARERRESCQCDSGDRPRVWSRMFVTHSSASQFNVGDTVYDMDGDVWVLGEGAPDGRDWRLLDADGVPSSTRASFDDLLASDLFVVERLVGY